MTNKSAQDVSESIQMPSREISDPDKLVKNPLVSVKMITYNHEPYIAQAIEGIVQQKTNFPFELIIGEDCSIDNTRKIVLEYQKKYPEIIRVITSDRNVGAKINTRRTQTACRGKYIAFCEGDDFWHHPEKLQIQVDFLETHPDYGLVHSDGVKYIVEEDKTIPFYNTHTKQIVLYNDNIVKSMIEFDYFVITCSVIIRNNLIDEIYKTCHFEFSEKQLSGDFQLWLEAAYRSKVKFIDKSLVTYNILQESAVHTKNIERRIKFLKYCLEIHFHYADKYGGNDSLEMKKLLVKRCNKSLIHIACKNQKPDLAKEVLENSQKFETPLNFVGYLYFFGSQNNILSSTLRALILLSWESRKILSHIKWLRTLRDKITT